MVTFSLNFPLKKLLFTNWVVSTYKYKEDLLTFTLKSSLTNLKTPEIHVSNCLCLIICPFTGTWSESEKFLDQVPALIRGLKSHINQTFILNVFYLSNSEYTRKKRITLRLSVEKALTTLLTKPKVEGGEKLDNLEENYLRKRQKRSTRYLFIFFCCISLNYLPDTGLASKGIVFVDFNRPQLLIFILYCTTNMGNTIWVTITVFYRYKPVI